VLVTAWSPAVIRDTTKLMEGVKIAVALQAAVFRMAVAILEKRSVVNVKHFRYAILQNNLTTSEERIFTQPIALSK
jgi:hypothetical protein